MGNAFERINKSGINLTSPSRELRGDWGREMGVAVASRGDPKKRFAIFRGTHLAAFLLVPIGGAGRKVASRMGRL